MIITGGRCWAEMPMGAPVRAGCAGRAEAQEGRGAPTSACAFEAAEARNRSVAAGHLRPGALFHLGTAGPSTRRESGGDRTPPRRPKFQVAAEDDVASQLKAGKRCAKCRRPTRISPVAVLEEAAGNRRRQKPNGDTASALGCGTHWP